MLFWSLTSCQQRVISAEEIWGEVRGPKFPTSRNSKCMSLHALICTTHYLVFVPTITQRILKWSLLCKGGTWVSKRDSWEVTQLLYQNQNLTCTQMFGFMFKFSFLYSYAATLVTPGSKYIMCSQWALGFIARTVSGSNQMMPTESCRVGIGQSVFPN